MPICRRLLRHCVRLAFSLAFDSAGKSMAARMAIIAITTSNSISVNPAGCAPGKIRQDERAVGNRLDVLIGLLRLLNIVALTDSLPPSAAPSAICFCKEG